MIRMSGLLAALLAVPTLAGCAAVEGESVGVDVAVQARPSRPSASARNPIQWKPAKRDGDQYIALKASKKAANSFTFGRFSDDIWAPFRIESSGGLLDAKAVAASNGARFCVELDGRATVPLQFYGICVQVVGGGLNAYAYVHTSQQPIGSHFFDGATEVEVAIEGDGATLTFQARLPGSPGWIQLAQIPFSNQAIPLLPGAGVAGMGPGAVLGIDNFNVLENSPAPGVLRPEQQVAHPIWEAIHAQLRAIHFVDGDAPDYPAASKYLGASLTALDSAIALAAGTDLGAADQSTDRGLGKARKSLVKAQSLAAKEAPGKAIINQLKKALSAEMAAAGAIYPPNAPP